MTTTQKSALFVAYNQARLNRALGLAQSPSAARPYSTTIKACNCEDARRGHTCKHRIAKMLQLRAAQINF